MQEKILLYAIHFPGGVPTFTSSEGIIRALPQKFGPGGHDKQRLLGIFLSMGNSYNQEQLTP